ncbi:MAG: hypothetical protein JW395_0516 [Nitrospira sp.]|jgi:hypothetical protein|nr:hypothetical protein [Nitrospira sp.]
MAAADVISCRAFTDILITQEPVYDTEIVKDIRPSASGLLGYYMTAPWDAFTSTTHTFDRVKAVFPNLTKPWRATTSGNCVGTPCDPVSNQIGMGNQRFTYSLEEQSWESQLMCFDEQMTRTKAKESIAYFISDILRPATQWITNFWLMRQAMQLSGRKIVVTTPVAGQLPEFDFAWDTDSEGNDVYEYLNITNADTGAPIDPTGLLTQNVLQREVFPLYQVGATEAGKNEYNKLELHTDIDSAHYLSREDPTLYNQWRFNEFDKASAEYYKYGFTGIVGDYMVKVWQTPLRFNRVSTGRFQMVQPYVNRAVTNGLGNFPNPDYQNAWYQFSQINNPAGLRFMTFSPEAVNPQMPYLVRSYAGQWRFAIDNLGADCDGKPIANYRRNKGKWWADFRWAMKAEHPEFLVSIFHLRQPPCLTIVEPCGEDPGYPEQVYDSANDACDTTITFVAVARASGTFSIPANGVTCNGNAVATGALSNATLAGFVAALQVAWDAANRDGTWSVVDAASNTIQVTGTTCENVGLAFIVD